MIPPDRYTCEEVFRRLDSYVDRELSTEEMRLVGEHLAICEVCAQEYAFEASVLRHLRDKVARLDVSRALVRKVRRAVERAERDRRA
jgi:anti-sigma factor RsiW